MVLFIIKESLLKGEPGMIKYLNPEDKVLLIQDGVLILNKGDSGIQAFKEKDTEVLALKEDLELRGIQNNTGVKLIDYNGFVELIEKEKVFS